MSSLPTVADSMDTDTHAIAPDTPVLDALHHLVECGVTGAPVVDGAGRVLGLLSELDLLRLLSRGDAVLDLPSGTVGEHMDTDVPMVRPNMDVYYVAGLFLKDERRRRFPVVDGDGKLLAVITRKDLLRVIEPAVQEWNKQRGA